MPDLSDELTSEGLRSIGLSGVDEAAYELVLDRPESTVERLSGAWVHAEPIERVLDRLHDLGLVVRRPGDPPRYACTPPSIALDAMIARQEHGLTQARQHARRLAEHYGSQRTVPVDGHLIEAVVGTSSIRQRLHQLQSRAEKEIRVLTRHTPTLTTSLVPAANQIGAGVACRVVHDRTSLEHYTSPPALDELADPGHEIRILPDLPMAFQLADDHTAALPIHDKRHGSETLLVVHASALVDALAILFEDVWTRAIPLDLATGEPTARTDSRKPGVSARKLTALLLSGLTDQAIARQLGTSHRTVQRHLATLMRDLGVHTRFQAGVQAAFATEPSGDRGLRSGRTTAESEE